MCRATVADVFPAQAACREEDLDRLDCVPPMVGVALQTARPPRCSVQKSQCRPSMGRGRVAYRQQPDVQREPVLQRDWAIQGAASEPQRLRIPAQTFRGEADLDPSLRAAVNFAVPEPTANHLRSAQGDRRRDRAYCGRLPRNPACADQFPTGCSACRSVRA